MSNTERLPQQPRNFRNWRHSPQLSARQRPSIDHLTREQAIVRRQRPARHARPVTEGDQHVRRAHRIMAVAAAATAAVLLTGGSAAYALGNAAGAPSRF